MVTILSDDQLRHERERLVKATGLPEDELRERAERYEVTPEQADALAALITAHLA